MNKSIIKKLRTIPFAVLFTLFFITTICVFTPFAPLMPGVGLDPSWMYAMNQGVDQGLRLGRDVVFTFGPYASIYTKVYQPNLDLQMLAGSLYLGACYGATAALIVRPKKWMLLLAWYITLAAMNSRDALFYSHSLLVALALFRQGLSEFKFCFERETRSIIFVGLIFSPLGVYPLIKGSFLVLCVLLVIGSTVFVCLNLKSKLSIGILGGPAISSLAAWHLSGQHFSDLYSYINSMTPIVLGYTEAMAIEGPVREVVIYIFSAIVILRNIPREVGLVRAGRGFVAYIFITYLFVAFKGGFVRHDGHAVIAGESILLASILYALTFETRRAPVVLLAAVATWGMIDTNYNKTSTEKLGRSFNDVYQSAWNGISRRIRPGRMLTNDFLTEVGKIRDSTGIPLMEGGSDIYPYEQSSLIASGNKWAPRPIFQSYSAYTPDLIEKNSAHLLSKNSPENIIYKLDSIDGRLPSMDDGASLPLLLTKYYPVRMFGNQLILRKINFVPDVSRVTPIGIDGDYFVESPGY